MIVGAAPRWASSVALFAFILAGSSVAAEAFRAKNWLEVVPVSETEFEVIEDYGAGAADMWCAAADYARQAGLDGVRKRIYVLDVRGASKTRTNEIGVVFTASPDAAMRDTPASYSVTVTRAGENLAISHAYAFCEKRLDLDFGQF